MLLLLLTVVGAACTPRSSAPSSGTTTAVIGLDGQPLGSVRFPTSCSDDAQPGLQQGLALLHSMTYLEAERRFEDAARIDPECALAYWGQAMTRVHPLWPDVPSTDDMTTARRLLARATGVTHTSAREGAYVSALQAYLEGGPESREADRLARFLSGWQTVRDAHADDLEAKLFYALALMATADLSDTTYETLRSAGAVVEEVLAQIPDHPGGLHYVIHAYDVPPLAEQALSAARQYGETAPENSHALHMTSHIFTRVGLWPESITYNTRAAAAAIGRTPEGTVSMHYMHALDYLTYAYLQTADDRAANDVIQGLQTLEPPFQNHAATSYAFAAIPARVALERHDWRGAARLEARSPEGVLWEQYPNVVAITEFARALGAARSGDAATAEAAIAVLAGLQDRAEALPGKYDWGVQVAIQRTTAMAWVVYERGEVEQGLELMSQAARMEQGTEKNPVTPGAVLPATELYGDMLLEAHRWGEAGIQFDRALLRSPNRFNSLFGAGQAAERAGDADAAAVFYQTLVDNCTEAVGERPELEYARRVLQGD